MKFKSGLFCLFLCLCSPAFAVESWEKLAAEVAAFDGHIGVFDDGDTVVTMSGKTVDQVLNHISDNIDLSDFDISNGIPKLFASLGDLAKMPDELILKARKIRISLENLLRISKMVQEVADRPSGKVAICATGVLAIYGGYCVVKGIHELFGRSELLNWQKTGLDWQLPKRSWIDSEQPI